MAQTLAAMEAELAELTSRAIALKKAMRKRKSPQASIPTVPTKKRSRVVDLTSTDDDDDTPHDTPHKTVKQGAPFADDDVNIGWKAKLTWNSGVEAMHKAIESRPFTKYEKGVLITTPRSGDPNPTPKWQAAMKRMGVTVVTQSPNIQDSLNGICKAFGVPTPEIGDPTLDILFTSVLRFKARWVTRRHKRNSEGLFTLKSMLSWVALDKTGEVIAVKVLARDDAPPVVFYKTRKVFESKTLKWVEGTVSVMMEPMKIKVERRIADPDILEKMLGPAGEAWGFMKRQWPKLWVSRLDLDLTQKGIDVKGVDVIACKARGFSFPAAPGFDPEARYKVDTRGWLMSILDGVVVVEPKKFGFSN